MGVWNKNFVALDFMGWNVRLGKHYLGVWQKAYISWALFLLLIKIGSSTDSKLYTQIIISLKKQGLWWFYGLLTGMLKCHSSLFSIAFKTSSNLYFLLQSITFLPSTHLCWEIICDKISVLFPTFLTCSLNNYCIFPCSCSMTDHGSRWSVLDDNWSQICSWWGELVLIFIM